MDGPGGDGAGARPVPQGGTSGGAAADHHRGRPGAASWCDRCGRGLGEGSHEACAAARALEPPRYCPFCRRRMVVQVLPAGWTATCAAHGQTRSSG